MRSLAAFLFVALLIGSPQRAAGQDMNGIPVPPPVLDDDQLFKKYVVSTVGPSGLIGASVAAAYEQYVNYPEDWGKSAPGYAKRWGSAYAAGVIGNSTKYAVARALHQDPSFTRCRCSGFNARLKHAVLSVFTARTRNGREVFSPATVAGYTAEHVVPATLWFPRKDRWHEGAALVGVGIGSKVAINIFHEFIGHPRIVIGRE